jgi:hypothetical protein
LGLASCVSYIESKNSHMLNMELIITSMNLMLSILEDNTLVYEYKTGPYLGQAMDKTFI